MGFVHQVVPAAELLAAAHALATAMLALSPLSLRASKQVVMRGLDEPSLENAYAGQMQHPALKSLWKSEDLREGPLAFAQKRRPEWKGR
jgi:enoyl-CoA hydratase/carnithine racemase